MPQGVAVLAYARLSVSALAQAVSACAQVATGHLFDVRLVEFEFVLVCCLASNSVSVKVAEVQVVGLKQNPLFLGDAGALDERSSMAALGMVMASLHPSIRESVDAKHDSISQLVSAHSMLSTAARLLLMAVGSDMPEHLAAQNAFAVTEAALHASSRALHTWREAHTDLVRKMLKHPPPKPEDVQLFYEYAYMCRLV